MKSRRARALVALGAAAMAWVVIAPVPAQAAPKSVAAATPKWSSSKLVGTVTYTTAVSGRHTISIQLVRATTSTKPACLTSATGCAGVSGVTLVGTPITNMMTSTLAANRTYSQSLTATCRAATGTKWYWTWTKVVDSTGLTTSSVSPLSGAFC